ncbi:carboxylesterase family protein [Actimicrobium sp. CCI2.3]|uniref:carboxylesterase family protein n=1 Tax=Actimicrobium sp. CCI2.3 TaxID=3048616 RepID=UPI002AB48B61|nr:carboxylesterase family protein [Actimicrobium sp. CCI2.3]MDY7573107.1 carboxylesterase family protein [Actimicrobium sp. CCI2.3]
MSAEGAVEKSGNALILPLSVPKVVLGVVWHTTVFSENFLYLNVYTNFHTNTTTNKPVFVWIHGGSNKTGTAMTDIYNPTPKTPDSEYSPPFMKTVGDAVVVTINYRLGPFGFLAHTELTNEVDERTSGTYGNLDQIMALKWVQDNIAQFGGDPGNVTLFGESAGALDTSILNASPLARGLFKQTIQQSGYSLPVFWTTSQSGVLSRQSSAYNTAVFKDELAIPPFDAQGKPRWPTLDDQQKIGAALVKVLQAPCPTGVKSGQDKYDGLLIHKPWGACGYSGKMDIAALRALSPGIIGAAYSNSGISVDSTPVGLGISVVAPPIDGKLLTAQPVDILNNGPTSVDVRPSIIGSNRDEYSLLLSYNAPTLNDCVAKNVVGNCSENAAKVNILAADGAGFKEILKAIFGPTNGETTFQNLPEQYRPMHSGKVDYTYASDVRDAVVSLLTDAVFTCHSRRLTQVTAKASAKKGSSYRYQMTYRPGVSEEPTGAGLAFAYSLGYPFSLKQMGTFHILDIGYVFGMPFLSRFFDMNKDDTQLAVKFQSAWGEFGKTKTMRSFMDGPNLVYWTAYPTGGPFGNTADPVFKFDRNFSVSEGTLSSASGNQIGSTQNYTSACDWIDYPVPVEAMKFASPPQFVKNTSRLILGKTFTTGAKSVFVTDLGYLNDGMNNTHQVNIYQVSGDGLSGTLVTGASASVTTTGSDHSSFTYVPITKVQLAANTTYQIVANNITNGIFNGEPSNGIDAISLGDAIILGRTSTVQFISSPNLIPDLKPIGPNLKISLY